ncbi:MAG TPA: NAD-dependent epimerase/dehydratase family protein [Candidatus Wallbacteria bacterium]|nr:NAD-dependent epimerase/dehydratase family protein [Candidatus Wallbacteria bacterium]
MKVVVLGGSRLVGASLVPAILKNFKDAEVHVVNRGVTPPAVDFEEKFPGRVFHHIADRSTPLNFRDSLENVAAQNVDVVIDLSCYTKDELTPAIRAFSKRTKQYIFVSTASVYGALQFVPATEEHPLDISEHNSMYGREKIKCEKELLYSAKTGDFKVTIIRPTYIYGPHDQTLRLFYLLDRICKDIPIFIPSEGNDPLFNAIFVKDLAEQICRAVLNEKFYNEAYNAASNDSLHFSDLLNTIGDCLEKPEVRIVYVSNEEFKKVTGGLMFPYSCYHSAYDCAKMRAAIGEDVFPFTPYKDAISETIAWHRSRNELPSTNNYAGEKKYFTEKITKSIKAGS